MKIKEEIKELLIENSDSWQKPGVNNITENINLDDFVDDLIDKYKVLPIPSNQFDYEIFANIILKYDYNELLSGKCSVCEKGGNSTIVSFDTKAECFDWVIQNKYN